MKPHMSMLVQRRHLCTGVAIVASGMAVAEMVRSFSGWTTTDFLASLAAAHLLLSHAHQLYSAQSQAAMEVRLTGQAAHQWVRYIYPPLYAGLLLPLAGLSPNIGLLIWDLFLVGIEFFACSLIAAAAASSSARRPIFFSALAACATTGAGFGIALGQSEAFILLGVAAAMYELSRGREWSAGACLFVTCIKPQDMLGILVVLLLSRRWKILAAWAAGGVVWVASSLVLVGPHAMGQFFSLASHDDNMPFLVLSGGVTGALAQMAQSPLPAYVAAGVILILGAWVLNRYRARLLSPPLLLPTGICLAVAADPKFLAYGALLFAVLLPAVACRSQWAAAAVWVATDLCYIGTGNVVIPVVSPLQVVLNLIPVVAVVALYLWATLGAEDGNPWGTARVSSIGEAAAVGS